MLAILGGKEKHFLNEYYFAGDEPCFFYFSFGGLGIPKLNYKI